MQIRKFEYGHGNAIILLVAEQLGLSPALVNDAKRTLTGETIHPMTGAAIEKEAARVNDLVREKGADALALANTYAESLKAMYGFIEVLELKADSSPSTKVAQQQWQPVYSKWRHGGWYVNNVQYQNGACGCVSNNYPDKKWRIVCDPRRKNLGGEGDFTFSSRDAAAQAERDLSMMVTE